MSAVRTSTSSIIEPGTSFESIDVELNKLPTTSAKIRFLLAQNWTRGQVAKKLDIRYQHVRNVELQPLKRS